MQLLAKNLFQLHGTNANGNTILKKKISREKLLEFVIGLKPCQIYMEACGSSNYWGRKFTEMGHKVKLINPRYVKPYVKRNKNDANDAAGIAAAARDPDMRFCDVKTEAQQDMQSIHHARSLLMQQRTAVINQLRGLLSEYGIVFAKGSTNVRKNLLEILDENKGKMSEFIISTINNLHTHLVNLENQIAIFDDKIKEVAKNNESCQLLATIPGVGILGSTILAAMLGNGAPFKNDRHFAAYLGLTPKQHSSGGKERLLGISKAGDTYVRTLLIHGARAVLRWIDKNSNKRDINTVWIKSVLIRKGNNKAAVALANKIARIAWALVHTNQAYNANYDRNAGSLATAL